VTRTEGIKGVLGTFGTLCVFHVLPFLALGARAEVPVLPLAVAALGLLFTIGAWQRDFWGFVGVLALCVTGVVYDVVVMVAAQQLDPIALMNALLYFTIAAALFSARRQFPRPSASRRDRLQ
jgi:hypothetical protein